jgi:hypothetical protein
MQVPPRFVIPGIGSWDGTSAPGRKNENRVWVAASAVVG